MFDHIGIGVSDVGKSKQFYQAALAPLGIELVNEFPQAVGFGKFGKPFFWIGDRTPGPMHIAFAVPNREIVDHFFRAAIDAGASDNGPPGLRPMYHENYYGAFVLDLDGYNIEAVCHE